MIMSGKSFYAGKVALAQLAVVVVTIVASDLFFTRSARLKRIVRSASDRRSSLQRTAPLGPAAPASNQPAAVAASPRPAAIAVPPQTQAATAAALEPIVGSSRPDAWSGKRSRKAANLVDASGHRGRIAGNGGLWVVNQTVISIRSGCSGQPASRVSLPEPVFSARKTELVAIDFWFTTVHDPDRSGW